MIDLEDRNSAQLRQAIGPPAASLPRPVAKDYFDLDTIRPCAPNPVNLRLEPDLSAQIEPHLALEEAGRVVIVHDLCRAAARAKQEGEVGLYHRVGWIRVVGPLEVSQ